MFEANKSICHLTSAHPVLILGFSSRNVSRLNGLAMMLV